MSRSRAPEQGLQYLQDKNTLYQNNMFSWGIKEIDGNRDRETIFHELKNIISANSKQT